MINVVENQTLHTDADKILGYEQYRRFPGTTMSFPAVKLPNGLYNHSVPKGSDDRKFIEMGLLNGSDLDSMEGVEYLKSLRIRLNTECNIFDETNPLDLLKKYIIFSSPHYVATSKADLEGYEKANRPFVIIEENQEVKEDFASAKASNNAIAKLATMEETKPMYMITLAKYLAPSSHGIKDKESAYNYLNNLIRGEYTNKKEKDGIKLFENALKMDEIGISITVDVKTAILLNIILRTDAGFKNKLSQTRYGRTEEEVVQFLSMDSNKDELGENDGTGKAYSVRYQLLNYNK